MIGAIEEGPQGNDGFRAWLEHQDRRERWWVEQDFAYLLILLHSIVFDFQSPGKLIIADRSGNRIVQAAVSQERARFEFSCPKA